MFTNMMIDSLEKKGYMVLTAKEAEQFDNMDNELDTLRRTKTKLTKKFNNLLKSSVKNMTIKSMREDLAAAGVVDIPTKKAELIDLYVKTFQE